MTSSHSEGLVDVAAEAKLALQRLLKLRRFAELRQYLKQLWPPDGKTSANKRSLSREELSTPECICVAA